MSDCHFYALHAKQTFMSNEQAPIDVVTSYCCKRNAASIDPHLAIAKINDRYMFNTNLRSSDPHHLQGSCAGRDQHCQHHHKHIEGSHLALHFSYWREEPISLHSRESIRSNLLKQDIQPLLARARQPQIYICIYNRTYI